VSITSPNFEVQYSCKDPGIHIKSLFLDLIITKLATHRKQNQAKCNLKKKRLKPCKFWNENVKILEKNNKFKRISLLELINEFSKVRSPRLGRLTRVGFSPLTWKKVVEWGILDKLFLKSTCMCLDKNH
jgi:hypothetical protein